MSSRLRYITSERKGGSRATLGRVCAFVLALLLLLPFGAAAALMPSLSRLEAAWAQGDPLRITLQPTHLEARDLMPNSLAALRGWFAGAALTFTLAGQDWAMNLTHEGSVLVSASESGPRDDPTLAVQGIRVAQSALQDELYGALNSPAPYEALRGRLAAVTESLSRLEGKPVRGLALGSAGRAHNGVAYALSAAQLQALWAGDDHLLFAGPGTITRYMNADGQNVGLAFEGDVSLTPGSVRRATLLVGYTANRGVHVSLKMPAPEGRDTLTLQVSAALTQAGATRRLKGNLSYSNRLGDLREGWKGTLSLRGVDTEQGDSLTGVLRLERAPGSAGSKRWILELKPDLTGADGAVSGSLSFSSTLGNQTLLKLNLDADLRETDALTIPPARNPEDSDFALLQALMAPIRQMLLSLPDDQRSALLHDMGRTARLDADTAAVLPIVPLSSTFVVTEEP